MLDYELQQHEIIRLRKEVDALKLMVRAVLKDRPILGGLRPDFKQPRFPDLTNAWDALFGEEAGGTPLAMGDPIDERH